MTTDHRIRTPICEECGYDLSAAPPPDGYPRCPECGFEFDPQRPFLLSSAPWWPAAAARIGFPIVGFVLLTWLLALAPATSDAVIALIPLILAVWAGLILLHPYHVARIIASTRLPKRRRTGFVLGTTLAGVLYGIAVTGIFLVLLIFGR